MVTIKEIAKECGVSAATVSNILNGRSNVGEATRQRVLTVIKERGYRPNSIAQGLRRQRTMTIGIIAEDLTQFSVPPVLDGAMKTCEEHGYRTIVQDLRLYSRWAGTWFDNARMVDTVLEPAVQELTTIMVDGILYVAGHGRHMNVPRPGRIPIALAYAYSNDPEVPYTVMDDRDAAYQMMEYLLSMGHRKIGIIAGMSDNIHTRLRLEGCQKAFFEAGLLYDPEMIAPSTWNKAGGYREMDRLVKKGATAVFCMNDRMAGGAYQYCHEHGLTVGKDISIAGFDGEKIGEYMTPELTTMQIPLQDIGVAAVEQLLERMDKGMGPESGENLEERGKMLPCTLRERDSVVRILK